MGRKKKRKKKKALGSKSIICVTTIAMLNIMGISYGAWNEESTIEFKVSTGNIDPYFGSHRQMKIEENFENCTVKYEIEGPEGKKITQEYSYRIDDSLSINSNYEIIGNVIGEDDHTLTITVGNHGTIPIKLDSVSNGECDDNIVIYPEDVETIIIKKVRIKPYGGKQSVRLKFKQAI